MKIYKFVFIVGLVTTLMFSIVVNNDPDSQRLKSKIVKPSSRLNSQYFIKMFKMLKY